MADSAPSAFEYFQARGSQPRRARPPDLEFPEERRVPLRVEGDRLNKRGSKMGLRSLFSRHKLPDVDEAGGPTRDHVSRPLTGTGSIRSSLVDLANWSHAPRPETALPSFAHHAPSSRSPPMRSPSMRSPSADPHHLKHKKSSSTVRGQSQPPRGRRGSLATWDPPPLFQAYPQAIKHATLPACNMSVEAIMRLHGHKGSVSMREGQTPSSLALDMMDEFAADQGGRMVRRRHRRDISTTSFKFDWTSKIYVLVTSGYLLQFASEGSFDRLPEKILQLGKDSAAFASDLIPGRHWVLQVSSMAEVEGAAAPLKPSLLSRLPLRGTEKRLVSNFLMVFESADDMDAWIAIIRREIEALGGKKNLSETGERRADSEQAHQIRNQSSQRTLVVRDPDRFSRVIPVHDLPWDQAAALGLNPLDSSNNSSSNTINNSNTADADFGRPGRPQSFDNGSTASGFSQDGRQLEGLRDSNNRLSCISSGQRTVITSAGSSPEVSPIREKFENPFPEESSNWERERERERVAPREVQSQPQPQLQQSQPQPRPRLRPNAVAIQERRQSLQTTNPTLGDMRPAPPTPVTPATPAYPVVSGSSSPPHATSWLSDESPEYVAPITPTSSAAAAAAAVAPNFSVPQNSNRRYSFTRSPPPPPAPTAEQPSRSPSQRPLQPSKSVRRPPPVALAINPRPLSFVQDLPSPSLPGGDMPTAAAVMDMLPPLDQQVNNLREQYRQEQQQQQQQQHVFVPENESGNGNGNLMRMPSFASSRSHTSDVSPHSSPRRYTSLGSLRTNDRFQEDRRAGPIPHNRAVSQAAVYVEAPFRPRSSMAMLGDRNKSPAPAPEQRQRHHQQYHEQEYQQQQQQPQQQQYPQHHQYQQQQYQPEYQQQQQPPQIHYPQQRGLSPHSRPLDLSTTRRASETAATTTHLPHHHRGLDADNNNNNNNNNNNIPPHFRPQQWRHRASSGTSSSISSSGSSSSSSSSSSVALMALTARPAPRQSVSNQQLRTVLLDAHANDADAALRHHRSTSQLLVVEGPPPGPPPTCALPPIPPPKGGGV